MMAQAQQRPQINKQTMTHQEQVSGWVQSDEAYNGLAVKDNSLVQYIKEHCQ